MTSKPDKADADGTLLTAGLRRVLMVALVVGFALTTVQVVAIAKLRHDIQHWAWVAGMDSAREQLVSATREALSGDSILAADDVVAAFRTLRQSVLADPDAEHTEGQPSGFVLGEAEAEALFLQAYAKEAALVPRLQEIGQAIDALQRTSGSWALQLQIEERQILAESERVNAVQVSLAETRSSLTAALLSAQSIQQQIIAIDRLIDTSSRTVVDSSIASLDRSRLPEPCTRTDREAAGQICSPSIDRVNRALNLLQDAPPARIRDSVRESLRALEGYVRAGQLRLQSLAGDQRAALSEAGRVRTRLANLQDLRASLSRINRVLLEFEAKYQSRITSGDRLEAVDRQITSYISQLRLRKKGLLSIAPVLRGNPDAIDAKLSRIAETWKEVRDLKRQRIELSNAFATTMDRLSSDIADHAENIRRESTFWVGVYATTFLVLAGLLASGVVGLVWLARSRFVLPLARVTGTIIALSRGELGQPFVLQERAFGFDRLGRALEHLRREMAERHELAERNRQQQRTIEKNLAELERANKAMEWLAKFDPLTGLGNRRRVDLDLKLLAESNGQTQTDFCIMQIDIDRFKTINDALGHSAGDFVLNVVSEILLDVCGFDANCYRMGGDEFLVIFDHEIDAQAAERIARDIVARIDEPIDYQGHGCRVGACIGIAFGRDAQLDPKQTVINADIALYAIKRDGRGGVRFFSDDLASRSRRRKMISDRVLAALDEKAFIPFYQPQFHANDLSLRGVEVLCRWNDAELGWTTPGEFLPVAEELGVVGRIDEVLFEKVAQDLKALAASGLSVPKVSFNVSADRLLKTELARQLSTEIGTHATVALELLESMSLDNPAESVVWAIDSLRDEGIEIEIDDFGSHRASLAGLMAIQPQAMKIDQTIVLPIVESPRHRGVVKKIIDIGAALNIEVVAEGVETEQHIRQLTVLGCDVLQGFGLARPMPFAEFADFCRGRAAGPRRTGVGT